MCSSSAPDGWLWITRGGFQSTVRAPSPYLNPYLPGTTLVTLHTWFIFWQNSYYLVQLLAKLLVHFLVQFLAKLLLHYLVHIMAKLLLHYLVHLLAKLLVNHLVQFLAKLLVHLSICESGTHQIQQVKVTHGRCNNSFKRHLDGANKTFVKWTPERAIRDKYKWAKIPSVTDASAPRFHQCSPNYKYQQLLSFMAV